MSYTGSVVTTDDMKVVSLRVSDHLHARMRAAAEADHRTLSNWLIVAAERALAAQAEQERQAPRE
jgi:predicted transcriptional regulator